tara:strand:+ start:3175 stop:4368 length:1194 start_codon:yes stop_codon:yes gene_type:complete
MQVNYILPFNGDINLKPSYEVKTENYHKKGKIVVVDRSASMSEFENEFGLAMSMIKALAGLDRDICVPSPSGSTNLIGKIKSIVESGSLREQELIVITDGVDNAHETDEIQTGVDDDGKYITVKLNRNGNYEAYMKERQSAILKYLEFLGCQVHIIGIGNEVKNLLKMAAPHRMTVAHINQGASSNDVANVVNAAMRTTRSNSVIDANHEDNVQTRIIDVGNLEGFHPVSEEVVTMIENDSKRIIVTDDVITIDEFKQKFEELESITDMGQLDEEARRYTRAVILFLLDLSSQHGPIPGAVIGGKYSKLFAPPLGVTKWPVNQFLSELKKIKLISATRHEKVAFKYDEKIRNFNKVECYELTPVTRSFLPDLITDENWCSPVNQLVRLTAKRQRDSE